jgi:hypothetical protein
VRAATIYQHPNAPVQFDTKPFDPREQDVLGNSPASVKAAIDANNQERAEARKMGARNLPDLPYPPHVRPTMQGLNTIHRLMDTFGTEQVLEWADNAAAMRGKRAIEGV